MFRKSLVSFVLVVVPLAVVVAQDASTLETAARALVRNLAGGRYGAVTARFDDRMRTALPAEKLAAVWKQITGQAGAFEAITGVESQSAGAHTLVLVTCRFSRMPLVAKVAFDGSGRVAGLFFAPVAPPSPTPEPRSLPAGLVEREVTVGSGHLPLPGTLTLPSGKGPFPAVVLVHGSGPQDRDETVGPNRPFRDLAWGLAERGVAVLRYEKRTHRYPKKSISVEGFTVRNETVDDARAAVRLLAGTPEIDPLRIFVLGHSLGGMLAPRIAKDLDGVAGLVIMAGPTRPLERVIVDQLEYLAGLDDTVTPDEQDRIDAAKKMAEQVASRRLMPTDTVEVLGVSTPGSYWIDLRGYDPVATAANLRIPILILQGGRDYMVTGEDLKGWRRGLSEHHNVTFREYPGLNHLFMKGEGPPSPTELMQPGHVDRQVLDDIAAWIATLRMGASGSSGIQ